MSQIIANEVDLHRAIEARQALLGSALDVKRPDAWRQYGYPETVTFTQLLQAYERGGAASGAVHRLLDGCWQELPRIKAPGEDKETPWETKAAALLKACWPKLRDLDRRQMVGRYAALIYRVADGKPLDQPLERAARLVELVPLWESQIEVVEWHTDPADPDSYGKPRMWQYRTRRPGADTQGQPETWERVHPSRVQILAEGSVGDPFDGVPLLRPGFNALIDMEKVRGGSGESYLKNSARTVVFEYERDAGLAAIGPNGEAISAKAAHEEQARRLNRNVDSAIVLQGGKANTLPVTVADPSKPWEVAACEFAAAVRIPFVVLFGQQTGRLASDQDRVEMAARCASRQQNVLTPMLEEFVKRMQACGVIDAGEFVVEWPPVNAPSEKDRLELLKAYTAAMQQAFQAGVQGLFEPDELRRVVGFEPLEAPAVGEGGDPGGE